MAYPSSVLPQSLQFDSDLKLIRTNITIGSISTHSGRRSWSFFSFVFYVRGEECMCLKSWCNNKRKSECWFFFTYTLRSFCYLYHQYLCLEKMIFQLHMLTSKWLRLEHEKASLASIPWKALCIHLFSILFLIHP